MKKWESPAVCTIAFSKSPLEDALQRIASAGYRQIDLLGRMPHFSIDPEEYDVDTLEQLCKAHGLEVINLATYFGQKLSASSGDDEIEAELDRARRALDVAVRFGARSMRVQPGDRAHETAFVLVPFFQALAREAEAKNIYLGVETHGGITSDPAGMVELCERIGSRHFGVLYDPCNLMGGGVDWKNAYQVMKDHIVYVHIKDGAHRDGKWERVMLGDGVIDPKWLVETLAADQYEGDIALEYEVGHIKPADTGLGKWLQRYRELIGA